MWSGRAARWGWVGRMTSWEGRAAVLVGSGDVVGVGGEVGWMGRMTSWEGGVR
ncbi:hypothetical protein FB475_1570 [Kribbella jejuensis]|uniref:Uncharacterized protein n=1 Tax=Kribbella jejuensis TaxID=236068 RepID=A0A542EQ23_9ACTN|nr:hypothetical protein FB475_1570 [Kribbella jejuensis]